MPSFPVPLVPGVFQGFLVWSQEVVVTAATRTVALVDNGTLFVANGAVTFTLPTLAPNYRFGFYQIADSNMVIQSAVANTIVTFNNATASSVAFQTNSQKIGGGIILQSNLAGTLWYTFKMKAGTNVLTVA